MFRYWNLCIPIRFQNTISFQHFPPLSKMLRNGMLEWFSIPASTITSFRHSINGQATIKPPGNQLTIWTRNSFHFRDFTPSTGTSHLPPLLAPLYLPLWTISRRHSHSSCPLRSSCAHHQSPPFTPLDLFAANYPPPLSSLQQLLLQALYHCRLCNAHCCKLCLAVTSVTPTMVSSASFLNPTLIHATLDLSIFLRFRRGST